MSYLPLYRPIGRKSHNTISLGFNVGRISFSRSSRLGYVADVTIFTFMHSVFCIRSNSKRCRLSRLPTNTIATARMFFCRSRFFPCLCGLHILYRSSLRLFLANCKLHNTFSLGFNVGRISSSRPSRGFIGRKLKIKNGCRHLMDEPFVESVRRARPGIHSGSYAGSDISLESRVNMLITYREVLRKTGLKKDNPGLDIDCARKVYLQFAYIHTYL